MGSLAATSLSPAYSTCSVPGENTTGQGWTSLSLPLWQRVQTLPRVGASLYSSNWLCRQALLACFMLQLIPQWTTTSPQQDVKDLIKKDFYFHWPEVNHKWWAGSYPNNIGVSLIFNLAIEERSAAQNVSAGQQIINSWKFHSMTGNLCNSLENPAWF